VFGLVAVIALWLTVERFVLKSPVPSVLGYATLTVETGSMAGSGDTSVNPGDMILIKRQKEYKTGDVITYLHKGDRIPTTHRIILTYEDGTFQTKGDANNAADPEAVTNDIIIGKVIRKFEGAGVFATWVRTEGWMYMMACFAILGLGLFILSSDEEENPEQAQAEGALAGEQAEADSTIPESEANEDQDQNQEE
jgi:signal peptidase I